MVGEVRVNIPEELRISNRNAKIVVELPMQLDMVFRSYHGLVVRLRILTEQDVHILGFPEGDGCVPVDLLRNGKPLVDLLFVFDGQVGHDAVEFRSVAVQDPVSVHDNESQAEVEHASPLPPLASVRFSGCRAEASSFVLILKKSGPNVKHQVDSLALLRKHGEEPPHGVEERID